MSKDPEDPQTLSLEQLEQIDHDDPADHLHDSDDKSDGSPNKLNQGDWVVSVVTNLEGNQVHGGHVVAEYDVGKGRAIVVIPDDDPSEKPGE